jgi:hypothetical protein
VVADDVRSAHTDGDVRCRDDNNCGDIGGPARCYIYDPTQADARKFYWSNLHKGYYQYGIKVFWLGGICDALYLLYLEYSGSHTWPSRDRCLRA